MAIIGNFILIRLLLKFVSSDQLNHGIKSQTHLRTIYNHLTTLYLKTVLLLVITRKQVYFCVLHQFTIQLYIVTDISQYLIFSDIFVLYSMIYWIRNSKSIRKKVIFNCHKFENTKFFVRTSNKIIFFVQN